MKSKDDLHHNRELGDIGEELAVKFLEEKGYKILHRNWHFRHKELDIVGKDREMLVVVEVKTRTNDYWEEPKEAVRRKKQRNIVDATDAYIQNYNIDAEVRFDIISVLFQGQKHTIEHIEDAFYPIL
jgi:putative endonuclease